MLNVLRVELGQHETMKSLYGVVQTYIQKEGEASWAKTEQTVLSMAVHELPAFHNIMTTLQLSRKDLLFPIRPTCVPSTSAMRTIRPALDGIIQHVAGSCATKSVPSLCHGRSASLTLVIRLLGPKTKLSFVPSFPIAVCFVGRRRHGTTS
jgi:hypothetical protein